MGRTIFVTVGTTRFDALSQTIDSGDFQTRALELGYTRIVLQYGWGALSPEKASTVREGLVWEAFDFTDRMAEYIAQADVVIGHCGSGTVLDVLRGPIFGEMVSVGRRPVLILVPNPSLMDNHQLELAGALVEAGAAMLSTADIPSLSDKLQQATAISASSGVKNALSPSAIDQLGELIRGTIDR